MGFQLKDEKEMKGNFIVENDAKVKSGIESWIPVVRNKHAECKVPCQELTLNLKENGDQYRRMDVVFRGKFSIEVQKSEGVSGLIIYT